MRDRVCLGGENSFCATADFVEMTEESNDPFRDAEWDGIMGLGQSVSDAPEFNIFGVLAANSTPSMKMPVFAVYLGQDIQDEAEITFGGVRQERMAGPMTWVPVYTEGYWQFQFTDFLIDGKPMNMCKKYGDRQCQAVLDTGSSLMMGPQDDLGVILKALGFAKDTQMNCSTGQKLGASGGVQNIDYTVASVVACWNAVGIPLGFAQASQSLVHSWLLQVLRRMRLPERIVHVTHGTYGDRSAMFDVSGCPVTELVV